MRHTSRSGAVHYLYRAVDLHLSARRDVPAAKIFFAKAVKNQGAPQTITLDGYAASHHVMHEMEAKGLLLGDTKVRPSKYLNNLIEQNHGARKQRAGPMLGFKRFKTAAITYVGSNKVYEAAQ